MSQLLTERVTDQVFHVTTAPAALNILKTGKFQLSHTQGSEWEHRLQPSGHWWFLSLARSGAADYARWQTSGSVMFQLDGSWFNQRYKSAPVDYWERSWQGTERTSEQEDRVFSRKPSMPADAVQQLHVLITDDENLGKWASAVRQLLMLARQKRLPVWVYSNLSDWRNRNRLRARTWSEILSLLRGAEPSGRTWRRSNYMHSWLELLQKTQLRQLSERARRLRYELLYYHRRPGELAGLDTDLSNARKPDAPGHDTANLVLQHMQRLHISTLQQLIEHLRRRWFLIDLSESSGRPVTQLASQLSQLMSQHQQAGSAADRALDLAVDQLRQQLSTDAQD